MQSSAFFSEIRRWGMALVLAGCAALPSVTARAADPAPAAAPALKANGTPIDCDATNADDELLACARKDLEAGQKRLDSLVKQTSASLPPEGKTIFEAAQKSWVAYRDADCRWNAYEPDTGRTSELILMSCLADLTISRMEELDAGISPQ